MCPNDLVHPVSFKGKHHPLDLLVYLLSLSMMWDVFLHVLILVTGERNIVTNKSGQCWSMIISIDHHQFALLTQTITIQKVDFVSMK